MITEAALIQRMQITMHKRKRNLVLIVGSLIIMGGLLCWCQHRLRLEQARLEAGASFIARTIQSDEQKKIIEAIPDILKNIEDIQLLFVTEAIATVMLLLYCIRIVGGYNYERLILALGERVSALEQKNLV